MRACIDCSNRSTASSASIHVPVGLGPGGAPSPRNMPTLISRSSRAIDSPCPSGRSAPTMRRMPVFVVATCSVVSAIDQPRGGPWRTQSTSIMAEHAEAYAFIAARRPVAVSVRVLMDRLPLRRESFGTQSVLQRPCPMPDLPISRTRSARITAHRTFT